MTATSTSGLADLLHSISLASVSLRPTDVADMIIVAVFIYVILAFVKKTRSFFVINSIIFLLIVSSLAQFFDLGLTRQILQPLLTGFAVIIVVVYQKEIRTLFDWFSLSSRNLVFLKKMSSTGEISTILVKALAALAETRSGAIIVLEGEYPLDDAVKGGSLLDGKVSVPLLLSIFDHHTPGHDGAVLIRNHQISAFGLHLPLAEKYTKYIEFGTRHRAAAGITEYTDALALVVSEEKGTISMAEGGSLRVVKGRDELEHVIREFLKENVVESQPSFWKSLVTENLLIKLLAAALAVSSWFIFIYQEGFVKREFSVPIEFRYIPQGKSVSDISPETIHVDLVGRTSDFTGLDARQLTVVIDASVATSSKAQKVDVTDSMVQYPKYFTLESVEPESVSFAVGTSSATST